MHEKLLVSIESSGVLLLLWGVFDASVYEHETYNILTCVADLWAWRIPWWVRLDSAIFSNTFHYRIVTHFSIFWQSNGHISWIILWGGLQFEFIAFTANSDGCYGLTRFCIHTAVWESKARFYLTASIINWITQLFLNVHQREKYTSI